MTWMGCLCLEVRWRVMCCSGNGEDVTRDADGRAEHPLDSLPSRIQLDYSVVLYGLIDAIVQNCHKE